MKLNMDLLCDALSHHKLTASITESSALYLRGPRLWGGNLTAIKPDYVYVTTAECLMSHDNFGALKNVICVGCNQYLLHKYENSANIIAIEENISLIDLFSEISEIFETSSEHDRDFLTAIATEQPIGEKSCKKQRDSLTIP